VDGGEETFYASSVLDAPPAGIQAEILGLRSPLAEALAGRGAGETIAWATPMGAQRADVVRIERAAD
jgi:transcription elongation GreA/GreB family factor